VRRPGALAWRRSGKRGALARRRSSTQTEVQAAALDAARTAFRRTVAADVAANMIRNVWSYAIIFCGHFPDQTYTFSQKEVEDESRGGYYVRQLLGPRTSRAARCSTSQAATSATRSSTTCTRTCRRRATRRSRRA
jgi:fatty acid desaturase